MSEVKEKKKMGRPKVYTKAISDEICARVAVGESLRSILKDEGMPVHETFYRWIRTQDDLREQYTHAKQDRADFYADELVDIADMKHLTSEDIQAAKLRIETRKWVACKLHPRNYGDKSAVEHSAAKGVSMQFTLNEE